MISKIFFPAIIYLICACMPVILIAQDTISKNRIGILPVPSFGYSPETGTYFGAVALFTFQKNSDSISRAGNAKIEFVYTLKKQIILETEWNMPFDSGNYFTKGLIHFSKYPDRYFANEKGGSDFKGYYFLSERISAEASMLKRVRREFYGGLTFKFVDYSVLRDSFPLNIGIPDANATVIGGGPTVFFDSRDHLLTPSKGWYIWVNGGFYSSKNDYFKLTLDFRKYFSGKLGNTFSFRLLQEFNTSKSPFFDLPRIGGDEITRGIYSGRFFNDHSAILQMEYRFKVYRRWGVSVFGGGSTVYNRYSALNNLELFSNAGSGLRFMIDRKGKTNLRLDYAIGSYGSSGFYVAFGESF
ncbi:MAG: hypothetical protein IPN54_00830 [Bacteroidetes bacterium]|nr:hypothetical protein [Bacteroidota bacterium]